jgi:cyclophilin family peptidyl-prolyl cis-trans isomerase/HEAT repeat protein
VIRSRAILAAGLLLAACRSPGPDAAASVPAAQDGSAPEDGAAAPAEDRAGAIVGAEHRRAIQAVTAADQQSRDVVVRRAAARALARIGGAGAYPGLLRALADEDGEVVAWGAYGLGFWCKGHEKESVAALVARSLSLPRPVPEAVRPRLDPVTAIPRAVGKCGAEESEPTLVAWLAGPREQAIAAAFALGDLASVRQKLREETLAALLNLAAGSASAAPAPEALFPVGRLEHVPLTVLDRLHEVATARLSAPGDARIFAVIALGRAGEGAAPDLGRVLGTAGTFTSAERDEAARGLSRLGKGGQHELAAILPGLVPAADPVSLTGLVGEDFNVLLTALGSIKDPAPARKALADLATLPPPPGAPEAVLRRVSMLRCDAAKALAGADFRDKLLAACDVTTLGGGIGMRAAVEVIGRAPITGPRLAAFKERLREGDTRAREAAVELLEKHDEVEGAAALLAEALGAKESGLVATAAEVLSKQPQRAIDERAAAKKGKHRVTRKKIDIDSTAEPPAPAPALVKALLDALARPSTEGDPESADSIVDAVGALALKEAKPRLDELCRSPYPTTREHAAKALALVSSEKKTCDAPPEGPAPDELSHAVRVKTTLSLDTDAGALTLVLDPADAPVAVTRVVDLARAGYYNGMVVHRVVPGFVAQFGAPFGDGFGGPEGKPAIRCETSPLPFVPLAVGVALAGRDTGSSQLFVMQGRFPHLDGKYALVGSATGPWSALAEGDVIRKVKVEP